MKALLIRCLALLMAAPVLLGADPVLDRAREREKAGDLEASASLLSSWLSANPGAPASAAVFSDYLRVEQDLPQLLDHAAAFLATAKGAPGAAQQFERIARLFDLAGRVEQARDAYLAAHAEGAPDSTLVSAFLLSVRMNDQGSMTGTLGQLAGSSSSARILLQALWDLRSGARSSARAALVGLSQQTGDPDLALKALWVLYESGGETGDNAQQASARQKLGERFPASPESALAGAGGADVPPGGRAIVTSAAAPGTLALDAPQAGSPLPASTPAQAPEASGGRAPAAPAVLRGPPPASVAPPDSTVPSEAPAPAGAAAAPMGSSPAPSDAPGAAATAAAPAAAAPPATASSATVAPAAATYSVQAGSFGMKENADDLCAELTRRGFAPIQIHDTVQGRDRYRVFAGSGMDLDGAKQVVGRLSAAGFYGFTVKDR